jgi:hypothetical protein
VNLNFTRFECSFSGEDIDTGRRGRFHRDGMYDIPGDEDDVDTYYTRFECSFRTRPLVPRTSVSRVRTFAPLCSCPEPPGEAWTTPRTRGLLRRY